MLKVIVFIAKLHIFIYCIIACLASKNNLPQRCWIELKCLAIAIERNVPICFHNSDFFLITPFILGFWLYYFL